MLDPVHWSSSRLSCVHTQKKVVIQERSQAQSRCENTSLTVLNWNGSENTFAVHTGIEPFRHRSRTVPRTVSGFMWTGRIEFFWPLENWSSAQSHNKGFDGKQGNVCWYFEFWTRLVTMLAYKYISTQGVTVSTLSSPNTAQFSWQNHPTLSVVFIEERDVTKGYIQ